MAAALQETDAAVVKNEVMDGTHNERTGEMSACGTPQSDKCAVEKKSSPVMLFDAAAAQLLRGLHLAAITPKPLYNNIDYGTGETVVPAVPSDKMQCSCCSTTFTDRNEQTDHYKSDWHRFNLKLQMRGICSVTEEQFEQTIAGGTAHGGDMSSISGSESDSDSSDNEEKSSSKTVKLKLTKLQPHIEDSEQEEFEGSGHIEGLGKRHPRVFLRNDQGDLLSIYRCVLHGKKNQPDTQSELVTMATEMPQRMTWAICMASGGHFAGAIFKGGDIVAHKTFHRYVVRAKRGTAQGTRDGQGCAPKSAGASLRRYNEAALGQDIQDLLLSWSDHLKSCDRLFLRAPSYNKGLYFGGKTSPLMKSDLRIRMIPFVTRRPTFKEVQRVHQLLATIEHYGKDASFTDHIQPSPKRVFPQKMQKVTKIPTPATPASCQNTKPAASSDSEQSDNDTEYLMTFVQQTSLTSDLNPFECTRKPKSKRSKSKIQEQIIKQEQKKKEKKAKIREDEDFMWIPIRNQLYTACKVGDVETIETKLAHLFLECHSVKGTGISSKNRNIIRSNDCSQQPATSSDAHETGQVSTQSDRPGDKSDFASDANVADDEKKPIESAVDAPESVCTESKEESSLVDMDLEGACNVEQQASSFMDAEVTATTVSENLENKLYVSSQGDSNVTKHQNASKPEKHHGKNDHLSQKDMVRMTLTVGVLNKLFGDNQMTLLHVAAQQGHRPIVGLLLAAGADPAIKNKQGQTPYQIAATKSCRNEFRIFMGKFPDKYDYTSAQVPGPLTAETEVEQKAKEDSKKKAQKKAKKKKVPTATLR